MPAEWRPHAATWTAWPFDPRAWIGYLEGVRDEFAEFVRVLAHYEPVELLVHDAEVEADARARLVGADVRYHRVSLNDVWFRDSGPIFVTRGDSKVSFVNWEFNAWGQKFEWHLDNLAPEAVAEILGVDHFEAPLVMEGGSLDTDGAGTFLTTRQCLLSPQRNPHLGEPDLVESLQRYLAARKVLWLEQGLEGDHTDGHVDTIARFVGEGRVVCCVAEPGDANHEPMRDNMKALRSATDAAGRPLEVVELPLPQERRVSVEGERQPMTYANFYVCNGAVLVPQYGDANDGSALAIVRDLFPGREAVGLLAREIIHGGGAFHCLTQQQPSGILWSGGAS